MTEALWPQIATDLGLPTEGVSFSRMSVSSRFEARRCVLKVTVPDHGQFVLRAEYQDENTERFQGIIDRQQRVARALNNVQGASVPRLLWRHPTAPHVLMELCSGTPLIHELEYCDLGFGDRGIVLERVGAALRQLHECDATGTRKFWPKAHLDIISVTAAAVRNDEIVVRKKAKLLGLCAYAHRAARRAKGQEFQGYLEHGDLHRRNILVSETEIAFIDFSNFHASIGQNDVANLWLTNCQSFLAQAGEAAGFAGINREDWEAFEKGYGFDFQSDPVFQFCFARRLVHLWQRPRYADFETEAQDRAKENAFAQVFDWLIANEPG